MNRIAFDLDNTVLDYGPALEQIRKDREELKAIRSTNKSELKSQVIDAFGEDYWTELQGHLYTNYVRFTKIDSEFIKLLRHLRNLSWQSSIISHKAKLPFMGPQLNMRACALERLDVVGIPDLLTEGIHFFDTKIEKVEYINKIKPNIYVDDLTEILDLLSSDIRSLLFATSTPTGGNRFPLIANWIQVHKFLEVDPEVGK
jgi:hypothetical protein